MELESLIFDSRYFNEEIPESKNTDFYGKASFVEHSEKTAGEKPLDQVTVINYNETLRWWFEWYGRNRKPDAANLI